MTKIGLVVHPTKSEARKAADELRRLAGDRGIAVGEKETDPCDVLVALGGDGTILRAARIARSEDIPLLGVNVGRLGFLSTADSSQLDAVLEAIASDNYAVEERVLLEATLGDGLVALALNEFVVEKATPSRVIDVRVSVDSEVLATYTADGFIVATPTGSTAYSLSAGGPVVEPSIEALVLTPVSAHSPLWRSIVVRPERIVMLEIVEGTAAVSGDGELLGTLMKGDAVKVAKHEGALRLINLEARPDGPGHVLSSSPKFFRKIRSRFNLDPDRR